MLSLVNEIETEEGKRFSELLATSDKAIWHDPLSKPETQEEHNLASAPLYCIDVFEKEDQKMVTRLTGAIYTFLRNYKDQTLLDKHVKQRQWVDAIMSKLTRKPGKEEPSLVKMLEERLGLGTVNNTTRWTFVKGHLARGLVGDPTLYWLKKARIGSNSSFNYSESSSHTAMLMPQWNAFIICGATTMFPCHRKLTPLKGRVVERDPNAPNTNSLRVRPETGFRGVFSALMV